LVIQDAPQVFLVWCLQFWCSFFTGWIPSQSR